MFIDFDVCCSRCILQYSNQRDEISLDITIQEYCYSITSVLKRFGFYFILIFINVTLIKNLKYIVFFSTLMFNLRKDADI